MVMDQVEHGCSKNCGQENTTISYFCRNGKGQILIRDITVLQKELRIYNLFYSNRLANKLTNNITTSALFVFTRTS